MTTAENQAHGVPEPWDRLQADHVSGVPIWVQLKTQLEYVIATGAVPTGTRLPSVRALANHVGVAVDTIRQTYDELAKAALVETQRGVGTFTSLPVDSGDDASSPDMTWARADGALSDLVRGGVDPEAAARAMGQRLAVLRHGMNVVFVGVAASVRRYADVIADRLPPGLATVQPMDLGQLRAGESTTDLATATYAVSLAFHGHEVEQLLADRPVRVLSLISRLEAGRLKEVDPAAGAVLVARPETRPIYLDLLRAQRPDLTDLPFVAETDADGMAAAFERASVVLHTSAAAETVARHAGENHTLIELQHHLHEKSLDQLVQTLRSDRELILELQRQHLSPS